MENVAIWLFTLAVCALLAIIVRPFTGLHEETWPSWARYVTIRVGIIGILTMPFNVGGDIWTIAGNASNDKGSVYSLLSVFQEASEDTITVFGVSGYQRAGRSAVTTIGVSGYQRAGRNNAGVGLGISLYQRAGREATVIIGISGYQRAEIATTAFFSFYQRAREIERYFGVGRLGEEITPEVPK